MNVLLLGSGGREHAFAWKIAQSKKLKNLYIAPGNPGTALVGQNVNIGINDFEEIKKFCIAKEINMLVVGPEEPLVNGIYDFFTNSEQLKSIAVIGASKEGAMLEGSKDFAKKFMQKYNIPTARHKTFTVENINSGFEFLETLDAPYVLKADGLAAGKGVVICENIDEAKAALAEMLNGKFGAASRKVVIEEFLKGIEVSMFVVTDGISYKLLPEAKDYKRASDGDKGANTGGMGAVSPVYFVDSIFRQKVCSKIIEPTIAGLQAEKIDYQGFIFLGLMNDCGEPYVIEYNVRMGDPETEAVLPRLNADLLDLLEGVATKTLSSKKCETYAQAAVTVICASGGYPDAYKKGMEISGIETVDESIVFQAGTTVCNNRLQTSGGRVLAVTSLDDTVENALKKSYSSIAKIEFRDMYFRKDIGQDILNGKK
ncbi:MAG: phosphoribosylamine--glycine ligase [Prevotellaceae bacterium]|jgi:phosphoribosylamine--glycine ligase|nr:phosphoribosylamine--glycine ligase [Prevotellaceae bacterium]